MGFLDVAEVDCVDAAALVGDDGRFAVAEQGPGGTTEEGMCFYVRGAGAGAEAAEFVFDEEFADKRFAETVGKSGSLVIVFFGVKGGKGQTHLLVLGAPEPSGKGTSSLRIFANVAFRFLPLKGVVPNSIS